MGLYISEDEYYVDAANHKVGPMRRLPEDADSAAVWSGECLNAKGEPCGLRPYGLAQSLRMATPVAVDGGYAFAVGDPAGADPQWIMGSDGKPYVLDIMALRDRLAARVPGAFR